MGKIIVRRRAIAAAASLLAIAAILAACSDGPSAPAPVYLRGAAPLAANGPPPPWRENKIVIVHHGQTLADIAHANHMPEHALIAANNLKPPYVLHSGARLVIPDRDTPPVQQAIAAPPTLPPAAPLYPAPPPAALAQMAAMPPHPTTPAQTVTAPPYPAAPAQAAAATTPTQPPPTAKGLPDIVPLDPPAAAFAPPPTPARNPTAALPPPGEPVPTAAAEAPGGRFPWPVHGRILANYGSANGGTRNEGINIAAPLGTPVRSIDGGTVAYVGNEVKGYGNLVLVKHANGWISAYAHLDDVMVKKGDTVSPGDVIGKVGDTGGVGEPQLHFELRRGKKPVDPKEFLGPAGSAAAKAGLAG
jgi:murein DD-endopeptidase MepM/ murein hydrolase activator NlpD